MFKKGGPTARELLKQSLSSTKGGYDLLAPKFDNTPFRSDKKVLSEISSYIKKHAPFNNALDVCTGTGAGVETLHPFVKKSIIGVDWSSEMLKQARKNLSVLKKGPKIKLVKKDIYDMNYKNQFDIAVCFGAYGHIDRDNQQRFLDNVNAALKPGGLFFFNVTDDLPWYTFKYIILKGFDVLMKIRNFLIKPEFIMYYLEFTKSRVKELVKDNPKWKLLDVINLKNVGSIYNPSDCLVILQKK